MTHPIDSLPILANEGNLDNKHNLEHSHKPDETLERSNELDSPSLLATEVVDDYLMCRSRCTLRRTTCNLYFWRSIYFFSY